GEPDVLLLNDGRGGWTPVAWSDGTFRDEGDQPLTGPFYDWGLSVMIRDFTGDGRPDLYVCNDFESPDRFWVNATPPGGPLRFRLIPTLALRNTSAFSMGVDAADLDRDGQVDFLVLDMLSRDHRLRNLQVAGLPPSYAVPGVYDDRPQFSHNTLFRGRGDGTFAEIGRLAGVSASEWSWTPVFLDVDLDGLEDLLISNGHEMDMMDIDVSDRADALKAGKRLSPREQLEMRRMFRRFNPPNVAFRNEGDFRFREVTAGWGFGVAEVANGMAAADLDGDGDLDLAANNLNAAPTLYRNEATAPRVGVRLRGPGANTRGLGARLRVTGGPRPQSQEMVGGGRYLSGDEALRVFAAGAADELSVEVTWPDGRRTLAGGVRPGTVVTVAYTNTAPAVPPPVP
ncbi:MAG: CRTAC1 family protein, partial [Verrucomicrobiota bacterium]